MKTNLKVRSKNLIRVADYIAQFLVDKKINDIFVLTGFGAMYINDAIAANPKLNYYCVRNEASSPMMAEAYARIKHIPGAVCLTAGPGSTNAVPGLAEAWVDSAPVIVISGQVDKKHTTNYSNLPNLRTFGTAEIDIIPIIKPITKYAVMITKPESIRYHLEKAYFLATSGRPGPVWIDVPQDIQYALINPKKLKGFKAIKTKANNLNKQIKQVLKYLRLSKKPLIVAGQGVRQSGAISDFKQLISTLNIPFTLTRLGLDMIPYSHPQNMGLSGIKGLRYSAKILRSADFVLVLGARLAIPFVGDKLDAFSKNAKISAVDIEKSELIKKGAKIDIPLKTDVKLFLNKFNKIIKNNFKGDIWGDWLRLCQKLKKGYPTVTKTMEKNPIDLYYFMSRVSKLSNEENILVTDAGSNYYVGGQVFQFEKGQRELTSGTFAAMGLSIPLSIGAAVAKPKFQILAITGDGSLELNIQELKTISYYGLNIKLFVINNNGYLSMRNWQDNYFEGRRIGSDDTTGAEILNLEKVADAFDLDYELIKNYKEIDQKLKRITSKSGPLFVEVICDDKQNIIEPDKPIYE